jgi:transcriptional regulator with XRE-family HTH domain
MDLHIGPDAEVWMSEAGTRVGAQIRRLRKAKGWTVAQLAVYADMSPSAVSQIETGRRNPTAASMLKLAEALEVEVRDFFPLEQAPLPDLDHREGFSAWVAMLQNYEGMRERISNFSKLGRRERRRVLDEALDLFELLRRIYNLPVNRHDREVALLHDVLYQSVLRMVEAFEREQERGDADANIINIEEYKARLRQSA